MVSLEMTIHLCSKKSSQKKKSSLCHLINTPSELNISCEGAISIRIYLINYFSKILIRLELEPTTSRMAYFLLLICYEAIIFSELAAGCTLDAITAVQKQSIEEDPNEPFHQRALPSGLCSSMSSLV